MEGNSVAMYSGSTTQAVARAAAHDAQPMLASARCWANAPPAALAAGQSFASQEGCWQQQPSTQHPAQLTRAQEKALKLNGNAQQ